MQDKSRAEGSVSQRIKRPIQRAVERPLRIGKQSSLTAAEPDIPSSVQQAKDVTMDNAAHASS
jgi:hypothetical protein